MNDAKKIEIAALETMRLPELQAKYLEVLGEASRCPRKSWLAQRIVAALEAKAATDPTLPTTADPPASSEPTPPEATCTTAPMTLATATDAVPNALPPASSEPATVATTAPPAANDDALRGSTEAAATAAPKLSKLSVAELQARLLEVLGRSSASDNRGFLVWKIRQAEKGKIPVGPRQPRQPRQAESEGGEPAAGQDHKVLPLRLESSLVARLDEAWARMGLKSRTALIKLALQTYLAGAGETEVAALFGPRG